MKTLAGCIFQLTILLLGLSFIPWALASVPNNDRLTTYPSFVNLQTCCTTSSNGLALLSCSNKSSIERFSTSESNIILVTYATENLFEYFKYSFFVNEVYASRNGYNLVLLDADQSNFFPSRPTWNKVKILVDALDVHNGWAKGYDYVMWLDADFIFADFDFRIESLVETHPTAHIIASAGKHSIINSGSLIVRNSKWARQFLHKWWNTNRAMDSEQTRFDAIFLQEKAMSTTINTIDSRIAILPPSEMNSVAPVWIHHSPESPVLHLHGEMDIYRVAVFSHAKETICNAIVHRSEAFGGLLNKSLVRAGEAFPRFLNISRMSLLKSMVDMYNKESLSLTTHFRQSAIAGNVSLELSKQLSHMMNKYAQALTVAGRQESKALKRLNFDLLYYSLDQWKTLNDQSLKSTGKALMEWPELLYLTASAGYNLLEDCTPQEKEESIYKIEVLLNQLRSVACPSQKKMVDDSFSKLYASKGVIDLRQGHPELAKHNFKMAMDLLRSDMPAISNYTCAGLMISIAECYAEQRNKESSMKYLELAITAVNQPLFSGEHPGEYNPKATIMDPTLRRHEILGSSAAAPLKPAVTNGVLRNDHYVRVTALSGLLYVKLQEYDRAKDLLLLSNSILLEQNNVLMAGLEPNMKSRIAEGLQIIEAAQKYYHNNDNNTGSVAMK